MFIKGRSQVDSPVLWSVIFVSAVTTRIQSKNLYIVGNKDIDWMNDFIPIFQNLNDDDVKKELLVLQEERHHYEMRAKVLECACFTSSNQ